MKNKIMEKFTNFYEYLNIKRKNGSNKYNFYVEASRLKFKIINNSNGHNYSAFLDEDGYLRFNNMENITFNGSSISNGCIKGLTIGNNMYLSDIYPVISVSKIELLTELENLDADIKEILEKKDKNIAMLLYMTENDLKELEETQFNEYTLNCITGMKLPKEEILT
jgi:hypothetical protein